MHKTPELIRVTRLDSIKPDGSFFTSEGYFIDTPIVTSVGVFEYKNEDGTVRRELRLPEHVFDEKSLATYEGKPVILTHNARRVDKGNVDREHVGTILGPGYADGNNVRTKLIIHDTDKIRQSGLRELSLGYDLDLIKQPGTWKGQNYDAIQTNIVVNHLALVRDARAGDRARLNLDSENEKGVIPMAKSKSFGSTDLEKALAACKKQGLTRLDEIELVLMKEIAEFNDSESENMSTDAEMPSPNEPPVPPEENKDALPYEEKVKLIRDKLDSRKGTADSADDYIADVSELLDIIDYLQGRYDSEVTLKDNVLGGDVATGEEKPSVMNADSVDAIVQERLRLIRLGDSLNLDGLESMRPLDAKKAIIKKVNPTMRLDGKAVAYINAAFDVAVEQMQNGQVKDTDYQRKQAAGRLDGITPQNPGQSGAAAAREKMIEKLMNGGDE